MQEDGPLTGAPLNFPKGGPRGCPPAASFYEVNSGTPGLALVTVPGPTPILAHGDASCYDTPTTTARLVSGAPVNPALIVIGTAIVGDDLSVSVSAVPDNDGGVWVMVAQNAGGCCAVLGFVGVSLPPPP
jgi:hypothetical protein